MRTATPECGIANSRLLSRVYTFAGQASSRTSPPLIMAFKRCTIECIGKNNRRCLQTHTSSINSPQHTTVVLNIQPASNGWPMVVLGVVPLVLHLDNLMNFGAFPNKKIVTSPHNVRSLPWNVCVAFS